MKKIFLVLLVVFLLTNGVNAESDFESDYTLIDCVEGDNDDGEVFNRVKSFSTLKVGIEKTIDYINKEVNKAGNEEAASGITFNIKVKCSFEDLLNNRIDLDFKGTDFNNKLIIEGINDDLFIIKNTKFRLLKGAGNIIFENASFFNDEMGYFEDQVFNSKQSRENPISNGITIYNSYFKLNNHNQLGITNSYKYFKSRDLRSRYYNTVNNYFNKLKIINSKIDIELDGNYNFKMPFFLKDSEINFINDTSTGIYDVSFIEDGNSSNKPTINYSVFTSNEINIGGNNLSIENDEDITFLNNKIVNFNNIDLGGKGVFINNFIENNNSLDITKYINLFNNILKSGFNSSYDTFNYRRNFNLDNIGSGGIGWIYKRIRDFEFGNIDINSADLFKEVTGKDSVNGLGDIYVIFSY